MLTAIQEGDAIFNRAIEIASAEERANYIAQACGHNAVLRRQVEERVAEHLKARNGAAKPVVETANGTTAPSTHHNQTAVPQAHRREDSHAKPHAEEREQPKRRSSLFTTLGVVMLGAIGLGIALAIWGMRSHKQAEHLMQQAKEEHEKAQKVEEESRHHLDEAEQARQTAAQQRDEAVAQEQTARNDEQNMRAALSFFQRQVLAAGRPTGWSGGLGKDVTLRKAVDSAAAKIEGAFADRPLAEASLREMLGSTYLDLEEPALAVKQYERALALRVKLQSKDNPDTVACRNQLAVAYRLAGSPDKASRLYD